MAGRNVKLF